MALCLAALALIFLSPAATTFTVGAHHPHHRKHFNHVIRDQTGVVSIANMSPDARTFFSDIAPSANPNDGAHYWRKMKVTEHLKLAPISSIAAPPHSPMTAAVIPNNINNMSKIEALEGGPAPAPGPADEEGAMVSDSISEDESLKESITEATAGPDASHTDVPFSAGEATMISTMAATSIVAAAVVASCLLL